MRPLLVDGTWYCEHGEDERHKCVEVKPDKVNKFAGIIMPPAMVAEGYVFRYWGCPQCKRVYMDQFGRRP